MLHPKYCACLGYIQIKNSVLIFSPQDKLAGLRLPGAGCKYCTYVFMLWEQKGICHCCWCCPNYSIASFFVALSQVYVLCTFVSVYVSIHRIFLHGNPKGIAELMHQTSCGVIPCFKYSELLKYLEYPGFCPDLS